jgi:putative transposase
MIVQNEWFRSAEIRKEFRLFGDEFVVMPNHLHRIVWIVGADGVRPDLPDETHPVISGGVRPVNLNGVWPEGVRSTQKKGASLAPLQRAGRSLSSFIAGFKACVTGRAGHEWNMTNIWQRNYYEHIIRNETELKNIWNYIDTNPLRWQEDQLHPSAPSNRFNQDTP